MNETPSSHWNCRIIRRVYPNGEILYGIHEVYYQNGKPFNCTMEPKAGINESPVELKEYLGMLMKAFDAPILDYETLKEINTD